MRDKGPDYDQPLWHCVGRSDVFAEQQPDGVYWPVRRPITGEDIEDHLNGDVSLGTYVIFTSGDKHYVNFVVFDLDTYEEPCLDVLKKCVEWHCDADANDYPYLMLEASGGKGHHIWLFLDQPVEAYRVRAWLEDSFWPLYNSREHHIPGLEVFPKQDSVREGGFGNLVKLPLGVHAKTGGLSEIVPCRNWCSRLDTVVGYDTTLIPEYPERVPQVFTAATAATPTGVLTTDGPVAKFLKGEVEKGERNQSFYAFFTWCAWNVHLPSQLAWLWWEELNADLADPEDDIASAEKTMESAYSRPPADAAAPRPSRGSAVAPVTRRGPTLDELIAARRA